MQRYDHLPFFLDEGGLLRRRRPAPLASQLVIPDSLRFHYLHQNHSTPAAGHFGRDRTLERLQQIAYWPGVDADVAQFVAQCRSCQTEKITKPSRPVLMHFKENFHQLQTIEWLSPQR